MTAAFKASGVITLTTDFGHSEPFVGVMKGVILTRFAGARIVDLTHEIPSYSAGEAGFWLARCFEYFPAGTVHVAVVDPGVGTPRDIVGICCRGHALLAPDNGLLEPLARRYADGSRVRLADAALAPLGLTRPSATFHGRDIFAPVAAELASGRCELTTLGPPAGDLVPGSLEDPTFDGHTLRGSVVTLDHFGNLITNVEARLLERFRQPAVRVAEQTLRVLRTYGEARAGEYLALVNSFGLLEIAQSGANAARSLGVGRGTPVLIGDQPLSPR
jgi:S-adenosylmethionine hydrolase